MSHQIALKHDLLHPDLRSHHDHDLWDSDDSGDEDMHDHVDGQSSGLHAKTSLFSAIFAYICTNVGAGILSYPSALQFCGWFGLFIIGFTAIAATITANYLIACMFAIPGKRLKSYEDIGEAAMGVKGRRIVAFFQTITLFGVCTIFLILMGGNMNTLVSELTLHDWVFIFGACMIPIAWLKTMREVALLAYFGVFASLFVAAVVIAKGFLRAHITNVDYDNIKPSGISNAINIIVFGLGGHSVLPNIINEMKKPKKLYKQMTSISYFLIAIIYGTVAAAGYAGWGVNVQGNILQNMDSSQPIVKAAIGFITAHVVLAYPIPLNPVSLYVEKIFGIDRMEGSRELIARITNRTILVLLTIFIASVVPYFPQILSLISALSIIAVAFVFPPLFYYLLFRNSANRISTGQLCLMVFLVCFGLASSGIGLYFAIKDLVDAIKNGGNPFDHYFK